MSSTILLKFRGDKECNGVAVGPFVVGGMRDGAVYDINGMKFGSYKRIVIDGGARCDWQEIEFTVEIDSGE